MFELIPLLGKAVNSSCEYFAEQGHKQDGTYPVIPGGSEVFQVNWNGRKSDIRSTLSFHGKKYYLPTQKRRIVSNILGPGSVPLIYLLLSRRSSATWKTTTRAGHWWPGSPTTTLRTGWRTTASIGTTDDRLLVKLQILLRTQTWSPRPSGPSREQSSRSPAATTPATQLCCRPHPTACRDRRSVPSTQVTATSGMEKCGPVTSVLAAATCNMADSTAARTGFSRPSVMATFRPGTRSASGATWVLTAQWWWLAGEGRAVTGLITGLESRRLMRRLLLREVRQSTTSVSLNLKAVTPTSPAPMPWTCGFAR